MKTIEILIDGDAKITIESKGYKGKACALDTKAIEQALGVTTGDVKKPEYSQDLASNQSVGG